MSQSPLKETGSKRYRDAWRAINVLIRSNGSWSGNERNTCYLNTGEGSFRDISFVSGLDLPVDGRSFVFLDLEQDGDLDLILKSRTGPQLQVFRNDNSSQTPRHSLLLELVGDGTNRDAVGARATLKTNQRERTRFVQSGSGFLSQSSRRLHFGLATEEEPLTLEVTWTDGSTQQFNKLPEKGLLRLIQGQSEPQQMRPKKPEPAAPSPHPYLSKTTGTWLLEALPAPSFRLKGMDDKTYELSEFQGSNVLINFWATWCLPCGEELADWVAHSGELAETGLQVLAISVDEPQNQQRVSQFAAKLGLPFPVLYADDSVIKSYTVLNRYLFDRWQDLGIPTSFLLDEKGRIIKIYRGVTPASMILSDLEATGRPGLPFEGIWYGDPPGRDYLEMATAMKEQGLTAEARKLFEISLKTGRGTPEIMNNFAGLLLETGELERAEELLRESLRIRPEQSEARINLGLLLLRSERPKQAVGYLEAAGEVQPDDVLLWNALGSAYYSLGHLMDALRAFEEALRLGPETVEVLNSLGILYLETGQPKKAESAFMRATELNRDHYPSRLNLALFYFRIGKREQCRKWIREAQALDSSEPSAFLLEAELLLQEGAYPKAREILEQLLKIHPNLPQAVELLRRIP